MHDAVALERRGRPTAVVVTDAFVHEADIQRAALGLSTFEPVVIAHPLSTLSDQEIEARAAQAVTQIARVLTIGSRR